MTKTADKNMTIKRNLLKLNKIYEEIRKEAHKFLGKLIVKDINDAQIVTRIKQNREFDFKHDLYILEQFFIKYKIRIKKIRNLINLYKKTEAFLLKKVKKVNNIGIKNIEFGPITLMRGEIGKNIIILRKKNNCLDILVHPANEKHYNKCKEREIKKKVREVVN